MNNMSKLSGFIDKKIFADSYLQLSGNDVKVYMNCVNKQGYMLTEIDFFSTQPEMLYIFTS